MLILIIYYLIRTTYIISEYDMHLRDIFNVSVGLLVESFFQLLANKGGELLQFIVYRCFLRNYSLLVAI